MTTLQTAQTHIEQMLRIIIQIDERNQLCGELVAMMQEHEYPPHQISGIVEEHKDKIFELANAYHKLHTETSWTKIATQN